MIDIGLVSWMLVSSLVLEALFRDNEHVWRAPDALAYILIVAVHVPLLWRRRAPVAVLLTVCAGVVIYLTLGYYQSITTFVLALVIFSVAAYRPREVSLQYSALALVVLLYEQRLVEEHMHYFGCLIVTAIAIIAWVFGDNNRQLIELTKRLRQEQEERARLAVTEEQTRIARELHDVVAHHMSVISVQAGLGSYVVESDPATARSTLDVIAATAHEALGEMRRLLTVLRSPDTPYDSTPGLTGLPELIERVRAAGATVDVEVVGEATTLSSGLGLCVYRVVQESLTNVLKHADPPIATVRLEWQPDELNVTIADQGRGGTRQKVDAIAHGLIGMRERSRIYGGEMRAGRRPGGGFEVALRLPTKESA